MYKIKCNTILKIALRIFFLSSLLIFFGCTVSIPNPPTPELEIPKEFIIENVPYILPTIPNGCGNIAAEIVFTYYGKDSFTQ